MNRFDDNRCSYYDDPLPAWEREALADADRAQHRADITAEYVKALKALNDNPVLVNDTSHFELLNRYFAAMQEA